MGLGSVLIGTNQMVIQFNKGLLNPLFRYPHQSSHKNHKGEEYLGHHPPQLMREENIPSPYNGEDQKHPPCQHKKDQCSKPDGKKEGEKGVNILQPYQRNIPEKKDEEEKNQTGQDQKSDKDSLLGPILQ